MPLLVVNGAATSCTGCPGTRSRLLTSAPAGVTAGQQCMQTATIFDHLPVVNVVPFGACSFLSGNPCVPATAGLWTGGVLGAPLVGFSPVLTDAHVLPCAVGGTISITDPGQRDVEVTDIVEPEPDAEDDEPGLLGALWDDGGLLLDLGLVAIDELTVPSGEALAGIAARRAAGAAGAAARQAAKQTAKRATRQSGPSWATGRRRYWKKRAETAEPGEFSPANLERMRKGNAARHEELDVPMELHHKVPQRDGGSHDADNLQEVWPWEHDAIDPFRHYRGPRPDG